MVIASWVESNMACPSCGAAIRKGIRRFGPAKVICFECKDEIETGLISFHDSTKAQRYIS